jgi:hypothetical protein
MPASRSYSPGSQPPAERSVTPRPRVARRAPAVRPAPPRARGATATRSSRRSARRGRERGRCARGTCRGARRFPSPPSVKCSVRVQMYGSATPSHLDLLSKGPTPHRAPEATSRKQVRASRGRDPTTPQNAVSTRRQSGALSEPGQRLDRPSSPDRPGGRIQLGVHIGARCRFRHRCDRLRRRSRQARSGRSAGALMDAPAPRRRRHSGPSLVRGLGYPREAQGRPDSVRFGSGNPHGLPVNAGYCGGPARVRKTACLQRYSVRGGRCWYCLPCGRSRVRIPSAASEKACICGSFFV